MTKPSGSEEQWPIIGALLPEGWRQKARELGALRRERVLGDPERLLRALLAHVAQHLSLAETAVRIEQAGWGPYTAVALWKRLTAAEAWLRWMGQMLFQRHGLLPALACGRLLAVDGTRVQEPGATGGVWRVHWMVNLQDLQCQQYQLSDSHTGESFCRFAFRRGDVVLADRGYSRAPGIAYARQQGADLVVRVNTGALALYSQPQQRMSLPRLLRPLRVGQAAQWPAYVQAPDGTWLPGRLIARRLTAAQARRAYRRARRRAQKRHGTLSSGQRTLSHYLLLWTSLDAGEYPAAQVLQLYRLRWQIELVFKRLKSILGLGHLPKHTDASARAWLQAKMLLVLLVERLWEHAQRRSPWGLCRKIRCSPWREARYLLREVATTLLPAPGLSQTLEHWPSIARRLAEPPRKRPRQRP
jgi:hypothetical protein